MTSIYVYVLSVWPVLIAEGSLAESALLTVGENVTVHAYVLYDSSFATQSNGGERSSSTMRQSPVTLIENLFAMVEEYFRNESVMIRIKVENETRNDSIGVPYFHFGKSLDSNKTLQNLRKYAAEKNRSCDAVFYFVTNRSLIEATIGGDVIEENIYEKSTFHTFCTNKSSAGVVHYGGLGYDDEYYISSVMATAYIFGLSRFSSFTTREREKLNETFQHCPKIFDTSEEVQNEDFQDREREQKENKEKKKKIHEEDGANEVLNKDDEKKTKEEEDKKKKEEEEIDKVLSKIKNIPMG
uniref:28 kDa Metastriate family member n=1 Tax=Rhipicephalus zambeziensis TaxID=60191 RepID=A0A224YB31_9ACAR